MRKILNSVSFFKSLLLLTLALVGISYNQQKDSDSFFLFDGIKTANADHSAACSAECSAGASASSSACGSASGSSSAGECGTGSDTGCP